MANKNYEVFFLFKAQADAAIGQFHSTADALEELRRRNDELQSALGNIESFRAYQQNADQAAKKLEELKAREQEAAYALEQASAARKAASEELNQHELNAVKLRAALRDEEAQHKSNITLLREAKASEEEIAEEKLRHRAAVEELTKRLGEEMTAQKRSGQEKKAATQAEKEAERAKRNSTTAVEQAEKALSQEKQRLEECIQALKNAGVDTTNLEKAVEALNADLARSSAELEEAEARQRAWQESMEKVQNVTNVLRAASMAMSALESAARPVWELMGSSLESAASLEKRIDAVRAVSGASTEETASMTEVIRRTGATTVYTAEEAAQAMENMALAGWEAREMISGLPAVVNLAAAAGEDLAEMTTIVTDGMNAFQLSGESAAVKFADVLAKAATSSSTNVGLMGQALSYVETTAGNLGYSIEDVSLTLAAMANNALKGSSAGAGLNTILTRMSGANATAKKQMDELGLSMYDDVGQAKPLLTFLNELREAFRGFGDDAQAAQIAAYKLAGQRGMRGVLAIVNQSEEQWQKLTSEVYAYQGAADQISTTRLDNYSGKLQLLSDAWTDLKVTLGNQLLPTATAGVEALTGMVNGANELMQTEDGLALWAAGTSGAVLGMSKVLGIAASGAQSLYFIMGMLEKAGVALSFGQILRGLGIAAGAAAGIGALFALFNGADYQDMKAGTRYLKEQEEQFESAQEVYQRNQELWNQAGEKGKSAAWSGIDAGYEAEIGKVQEEIEKVQAERESFIEGLKEKGHYGTRLDPISGEEILDINSMTTAEAKSLAALDQAEEMYRGKWARLERDRMGFHAKAIAYLREEVGVESMSLERYMELEEAAMSMADVWAEVWGNTEKAYSGVFSLFEEAKAESADLDTMLSGLKSQETYWETYAKNLETLRHAAEGAGIDLGGLWSELAASGNTQSAAWLQELADSIGSLEDPDTSKLAELAALYERVSSLREAATDVYTEQDEAVKEALDQFDREMREAIEETSAYDEARKAMLDTLEGYTDTLAQEGDEAYLAVKRLGEKMRTALYPSSTTPIAGGGNTLPTRSSGQNSGKSGRQGVSLGIGGAGNLLTLLRPEGYASGTGCAAPGLHLVGEEGPELMWMRGGETVLNAEETREAMRARPASPGGGEAPISLTLNFQLPEDSRGDLREQGEEIARRVERAVRQAMRQEREDQRRRAFR